MFDISLILPTRERLALVHRTLNSVRTTANRPERIEVVLYADADDLISQSIEFPALTVRKLVGPRQSMGQITRACYAACSANVIMLANDDIIFRTRGWDETVLQTFAEFPDDIALVWGNDLHSGMPAHPFLSRTVCDMLGQICPAEYDREFIDTHLYDVFRELLKLGQNRMRYLPEVVVEHLHVYAGKMIADATFMKKHFARDERTFITWAEERQLLARDFALRIATSAARPTPRVTRAA